MTIYPKWNSIDRENFGRNYDCTFIYKIGAAHGQWNLIDREDFGRYREWKESTVSLYKDSGNAHTIKFDWSRRLWAKAWWAPRVCLHKKDSGNTRWIKFDNSKRMRKITCWDCH